jgi:hypothetical protein
VINDLRTNDFYIPEYKSYSPFDSVQINRINIDYVDNSKGSMAQTRVDCISVNFEHILDFIGQHHTLVPN